MKYAHKMAWVTVGLLGITAACTPPPATDKEIEQMCDRLVVLRGNGPIKTNKKKCIADAKKEGISKQQARCRISAVNATEYWVRCRTGKARTP